MKKFLLMLPLFMLSCVESVDVYVSLEDRREIEYAVKDYLGNDYTDISILSAEKFKENKEYKYSCSVSAKTVNTNNLFIIILNMNYGVERCTLDASSVVDNDSNSDGGDDEEVGTFYCGAKNKTGGYCKRKVKCGTRCWQHKNQ